MGDPPHRVAPSQPPACRKRLPDQDRVQLLGEVQLVDATLLDLSAMIHTTWLAA